ncbi:MAG: hypothetical protein COW19_03640 [Zetaproteobacteria bacterium CG12_big_fil_rev_8_21_14_0_65_55_1124]|nr:MAG: hypothetical protein AUJ58_09050 [Zetaproteobacteria bacterium CG1_02_55_237]PIS18642.1 MAG: hypothetical protein COT53_09530 [Zetaproteobacteria bacterium CG08_land_8_20_14_0_20_55_17]PIW43248.1 MAG: hypothetical protein COW19_03640 [Zetaproteobacteria bacterium CG12_big_fil_rev_8_21_14_0_65_55_1124]PIY53377.1 MAG: hypothetical protein COZ01_03875 [Zetaproteobacteria bacterium CG_4_10_14_0_8_um_filter_55_43]PIZ38720.1 MAG: hypothetical protein COY36_05620 [Zetaproteobacteria bacterium 
MNTYTEYMPAIFGSAEKRLLRALLTLAVSILLLLGAVAYVAASQSEPKPSSLQSVMQAELASQPVSGYPKNKRSDEVQADNIMKEETLVEADSTDELSDGRKVSTLPYMEGHPEDAGAYLRWILSRGGMLVLTKGFKPVALLNASFSVYPVPDGFRLPAQARNVSSELHTLFEPLPAGATLALLVWPPFLEKKLEQELYSLPEVRQASRLRTAYVVNHGHLEIHVLQSLIDGHWAPVHNKIVL